MDSRNSGDNKRIMEKSAGKAYRIGEVAELLRLKTSVLRFWESEFPQIDPQRTEKGQRIYNADHIALLRRIQQLLHEQGLTIDGARKVLEGKAIPDLADNSVLLAVPDEEFMSDLARELEQIRNLLAEGIER